MQNAHMYTTQQVTDYL